MYDVVVIGAGQAGLATAYALKQSGLRYLVLEATERAAGSWPSYYDSLTLFSPARYSHLPGLPFSGDQDRYPSRGEVITYLEAYAQHFAFPITFNSRVTKIEREGGDFCLVTEKQERFLARAIVVASGPFNQPNIPALNGLTEFTGQTLHSSEYRHPADIRGARVAVIGAGNSAVQIAYELCHTHEVLLTSREPPRFLQQRPLGKDLHFWFKYSGIETLPLGHWFNRKSTAPVLDSGFYRNAIHNGQIQYRPMFEGITVDGLRRSDTQKQFDALVFASGFVNQPAYLES